jgi:hypothetical protein
LNAIAELELSSRRSDLAPGPGSGATLEDETAENLVSDVKRYVLMGIDLCERFSKEMKMKSISRKGKVVTTLNDAEQMWLNLLETAVVFSREVASTVSEVAANTDDDGPVILKSSIRCVSLYRISSPVFFLLHRRHQSPHRRASTQISFLEILPVFLQNLSSSPLTDLRSVLSSIFDAYRYEKQLIKVTSRLVDADLFQEIVTAKKERECGW